MVAPILESARNVSRRVTLAHRAKRPSVTALERCKSPAPDGAPERCPSRVGLATMGLAAGCPRQYSDDSPSIGDLEAVIGGGHGDDLAGLDHVDVDAVDGSHDEAALGHWAGALRWGTALDHDRTGPVIAGSQHGLDSG